MNILSRTASAVVSSTAAAKKIYTGDVEDKLDSQSNKLVEFLSTLATYPYLYISSTFKGKGRASAGPGVLAPEARSSITDFPEGRALVTLEKFCRQPAHLSSWEDLWYRSIEHGKGYLYWYRDNQLADNAYRYLESISEAAPGETIEDVVASELSIMEENGFRNITPFSKGRDTDASGTHEEAHEPAGEEIQSPISHLQQSLEPNMRHMARQLQRKFVLTRNRTWFELSMVFLNLVRIWLNFLSFLFRLLATGLRMLGNLMSVLSGALAFTVVISVALSIVAATLFLGASASDGISALLDYMASFADIARSRSARVKRMALEEGITHDLVGPQTMPAATIEELEDFFASQLAARLVLRTRPDATRLGDDPLLVRCFDLNIIDGAGNLIVHSPEEVMDKFHAEGFFGFTSAAGRKAGALLLLRLLAWKRIGAIHSQGEALKYVFVLGQDTAGPTEVFARLANLEADYKVYGQPMLQVPSEKVPAEIRLVSGLSDLRQSYAILVPGLRSPDPQVATQARTIADVRHGVISCLIFVVSIDQDPTAAELEPLWQCLHLRKPSLLLVHRASHLAKQIQSDPQSVDEIKAQWQQRIAEEGARRGLETEHVSVMVAEMSKTPPAGVAGAQQVQDWLAVMLKQGQR